MADQLSMFIVPDGRDGIEFNGENAYNVEQWVRTRKGHASMIAKPTPQGIEKLMRIAQGDLTLNVGDTLFYDNGEFFVE